MIVLLFPTPLMRKFSFVIAASLLLSACGQSDMTVNTSPTPVVSISPIVTSTATPTPSPSPSTPSVVPSLQSNFTGTIENLPDLHLTKLLAEDPNNGDLPSGAYYMSAGTFSSGKFTGYQRIIMETVFECPCSPTFSTLATKDNKTYTLDTSDDWTYDMPMTSFDATKVTSKAAIVTDHPAVVALANNFVLVRGTPSYYYGNTDPSDLSQGHEHITVQSELKDFSPLAVENSTITFYTRKPPLLTDPFYEQNPNYNGSTETIGVDSTGLIYGYYLSTAAVVKKYNETNDPSRFDYTAPHLAFAQTDIVSKEKLFSKYDTAFSAGCSLDPNAEITKGIADSELKAIGTIEGNQVYVLKNSADPVFKAAYDFKITDTDSFGMKAQEREAANQKKPTLAQYTASNPLLFIKDPWNRLLMLQENEYIVPRECGKPVVYLYPTTPTKVTVSFTNPMELTTTIPTYQNQWQVLANPSGSLQDLQPEVTNCATLDTQAHGSEYAAEACKTHSYPYLYWAGYVINKTYPEPQQGWVVAKAELSNFMNTTLDQIGFTAQEKKDMLEYWLPEMLSKESPYYRISFLDTAARNQYAPMKITPAPQNIYRLFLDYAPMQSNSLQLQPQQLKHVERNGFTVVEWGGLKR